MGLDRIAHRCVEDGSRPGRDDELAYISRWAAPVDPQTALAAIRYIDDVHKRADVYLRTAELMAEQQPAHAIAAIDEWSELPGNAEGRDGKFSRMARHEADHGHQELTVRALDMISDPTVKDGACVAAINTWSKVRPISVDAAGIADVASRISDDELRASWTERLQEPADGGSEGAAGRIDGPRRH